MPRKRKPVDLVIELFARLAHAVAPKRALTRKPRGPAFSKLFCASSPTGWHAARRPHAKDALSASCKHCTLAISRVTVRGAWADAIEVLPSE